MMCFNGIYWIIENVYYCDNFRTDNINSSHNKAHHVYIVYIIIMKMILGIQ